MKISGTIGEIDKILAEVKKYRENLPKKTEIFMKRLAEKGVDIASIKFRNAKYDGHNDVDVTSESDGKSMIIWASGTTVLFIEFGTGVMNPEHPLSAELGYSHGTYGQGKGMNAEWAYYGEQGTSGQFIRKSDKGDVYMTKGNPPAKAMYETGKELRDMIQKIATEVFKE